MKKIIIYSLLVGVAIGFSACGDDSEKELKQDVFKVTLKKEYREDPLLRTYRYPLFMNITSKDNDIVIKKIMVNRGSCRVYDKYYSSSYLTNSLISDSKNPPLLCYSDIMEEIRKLSNWGFCSQIIKQYNLSKKYNKYYKIGLDDNGELSSFARIREEKISDNDIKRINELMPKLYKPYELPLKFGKTAKFEISGCSEVIEVNIYTNKGIATYTFGN